MTVWTSDTGRAVGVATIDCAELHQAIAAAAIDALRHGIELEWLDQVHMWRIDDSLRPGPTKDEIRREHLKQAITAAKRRDELARRNANQEADSDLAAAFRSDALNARNDARDAQEELDTLNTATDDQFGPDSFESELDFFAHALAALANVEMSTDVALATSLQHVLEFTRIDVDHFPQVTVEFHLLIPADGRVARLGPVSCEVANRAYPKVLPEDVRPRPSITAAVTRQPESADLGDVQAADALAQAITQHGWTRTAAGVLARANFDPISRFLAHEIGGQPAPTDLDDAYLQILRQTYADAEFRWKPGTHALNPGHRPTLIQACIDAGGRLRKDEADALFTDTKITPLVINALSREQNIG